MIEEIKKFCKSAIGISPPRLVPRRIGFGLDTHPFGLPPKIKCPQCDHRFWEGNNQGGGGPG